MSPIKIYRKTLLDDYIYQKETRKQIYILFNIEKISIGGFIKLENFGKFLFSIGIILAIAAGIFTGAIGLSMINLTSVSWMSWMLVFLVAIGLIVGLTSISDEKIIPFLIAAIGLIVVSGTVFDSINNIFPRIGTMIENSIDLIAIFIAPIAAVLSIKVVYALASKK